MTPGLALVARAEDVVGQTERLVDAHGGSSLLDDLRRLHDSALMLGRAMAKLRARGADWEAALRERQVAHDLKNPLGALLGYGEMLMEGADGELREQVAAVVEQAHEMLVIVEQAR